ncbi:hypothetical protein SKAU_G00123130 [Synaphobranchus kaupii]|uniref:Ig-like domain-containing protein n=1 Tax=Synaphobranchus kaupii TaxID=118154 RepID=A0A9Q1J0H2_SYNKA|nr:hypothetical protein SKAU_G00123130 [Synaphobranchus kaupii]
MASGVLCFILLVFTSYSTWSADAKSNDQFLWLRNGQSFTMRCTTTETDYDGLYVLWGLGENKEVFFLFAETNRLTEGDGYRGRVQTEGEVNNLQIKIANMTEDDSGVYWCKYRHMNKMTFRLSRTAGNGSTLVVVNGRPCKPNDGTVLSNNLVMVSAISAGSVFLLCLIVLLLWLVPRMKKLSMRKRPRRSDSVYEDMRKNNASHRANHLTQSTNHFP